MKYFKYLFFLPMSLVLIFFSCNSSSSDPTDSSGNWFSTGNDFPGDARSAAVVFVVGNTAYIGTGYNSTKAHYDTYGNSYYRYSDFWSYTPGSGWSSQLATPGSGNPSDTSNYFTPRSNGVAFTIGTTGYVTLGEDDNLSYLTDVWAYSTTTNTWTKKNTFGNGASTAYSRINALAFSLYDSTSSSYKGYVMCGNNGRSNLKDVWQYDASSDTWTSYSPSFTGEKRQGGIALVYKNKAYIVTGIDNSYVNDMIRFNPNKTSSDSIWYSLRKITNATNDSYDDDYTDIERSYGVGFVVGDSAYITLGNSGGVKTWGYDFKQDLWFRKSSFELVGTQTGRTYGLGFTLSGNAYVCTGQNGTTYYDDLVEWFPYESYNSND